MLTVTLKGRGDVREWRDAARRLLLADVPAHGVEWRIAGSGTPGLFEAEGLAGLPEAGGERPAPTVPRPFLELSEALVCHSDPARFDLLYRLLHRLQRERGLLGLRADEDVAMADRMLKSIRRDSHKMKAFVRFKEIPGEAGARRRFVAWFEPDHFIVARTAPFFQRRFNDMDWLILTPRGSAAWNGERLELRDEPASNPDVRDETDGLWRTYFSNIFNPSRLKIRAMQSEMPKKYWKNLPEAELIPGMIASAEARMRGMIEEAASQPPARHERRRLPDAPVQASAAELDVLAAEERACTRCPLHCHATQTVVGEGPREARLLFVGEQPGDREDLAGRPFIGPAGQVFDGTLEKAGISRPEVFVTNAVKHFKYEPRGKRRIHKRPDSGEIAHCRWWLQKEIEIIRPRVIVAMGATAVEGITGARAAFRDLKGRSVDLDEQTALVTTVHPSYLLRLTDEAQKAEETRGFESMIALAAGLGGSLASLADGAF